MEAIPSDLWDTCFPPPLEGLWWYRALERSLLESQFTFASAILERGTRLVGISPTFLMDVPIDLVAPPAIATILRVAGAVLPAYGINGPSSSALLAAMKARSACALASR